MSDHSMSELFGSSAGRLHHLVSDSDNDSTASAEIDSTTNTTDTTTTKTDTPAKTQTAEWVHWTCGKGRKWMVCKLCYPDFDPNVDFSQFEKTGRGCKGVLSGTAADFTLKQHFKGFHESRKTPREGGPQEGGSKQLKLDVFCKPTKWDWVLFYICSGMAKRKLRSPQVMKCLGPYMKDNNLSTERQMTAAITELAGTTRKKVMESLVGQSCMIAIDGGTILRKSYLNISVSHKHNVYFWSTVLCPGQMTADWIGAALGHVRTQLLNAGAFPIGVVSDSAANMIAAVERLEQVEDKAMAYDDDEESLEDALEDEGEDVSPLIGNALDAIVAADTTFFFHCRCWCHSLQLILHDLQSERTIALAVAATRRLIALLQRRQTRAQLKQVCERNKVTVEPLHTPCVTRWSSMVRAMQTLLSYEKVINFVLEAQESAKPVEFYSIRIALAVMLPVAKGTDVMQADKATIEDAREVLNKIDRSMNHLLTLGLPAGRQRVDLHAAVTAVRASLVRRRAFFINRFYQILAYLDPRNTVEWPKEDSPLKDLVVQYLLDRSMQFSEKRIVDALNKFELRSPKDRLLDHEGYWCSPIYGRATLYPGLSLFLSDLR